MIYEAESSKAEPEVTMNNYLTLLTLHGPTAGDKSFLSISVTHTHTIMVKGSQQYLAIDTHKRLYSLTTLITGVTSYPNIFQGGYHKGQGQEQ